MSSYDLLIYESPEPMAISGGGETFRKWGLVGLIEKSAPEDQIKTFPSLFTFLLTVS